MVITDAVINNCKLHYPLPTTHCPLSTTHCPLSPAPLHITMKEWLPAGTVIAHFQLSSRISANGIGEVYQATDNSPGSSGRELVLKLLPASLIDDQQTRQRFIQIFTSIALMRHHNFCRVFEAGITEDGRPFVSMEYVRGQSLDLVSLNSRPAIPEIGAIIIQIADTLDVLHKQGWLHLAIKPSNLMVTRDRNVKILDLGVGTVFPSRSVEDPPDQRSDVFSLGAVFYELLTGHQPFPGSTVAAANDRPSPIMDFREDASQELNDVVMKALKKDPADRYQTMGAFASDLRSLFVSELARLPNPYAWASDSRGARKPDAGDAEKLPPGSLIDDLKRAFEGLLENKSKSGDSAHPKIQLEHERSFLADIAYFCRLYWRYILVIFLFFTGLAIAISLVSELRDEETETETVRSKRITSLTTSGKVRSAAISPDGERLVYAVDEGRGQSLLLKELKSSIETRVISAESIEYSGLTFSRDGRWISYLKTANSGAGSVFRIAAGGGVEQRMPIANAVSSVTFSPDGKSLAAIIKNDSGSDTSLWVGDETGKGVELVTHSGPSAFQNISPAWSPDGRVIICVARDAGSDIFLRLVAIGIGDRSENTIVSGRWSEINRVAWLAEGAGMIVAASDPHNRRSQLWLVDYPSGDVSSLSRDWSDYRDASLARDNNLLVAVQSEILSNVWVARGSDAAQARQITTGRLDGVNGIAWTPDGRVVYVSLTNNRAGVWIGAGIAEEPYHRPLPTDSGDGGQYQPTVSADGRFIAYVIERASGAFLIRNEIERRESNSLTNERLAYFPQFAPDGKWIYYTTIRDGRGAIARIPASGGSPQTLINGQVWRAVLSPDGTKFACNYLDETKAGWRLAVLPVSGDVPISVFDAPLSMHRVIQWTPDGERLAYVVTRDGVSNIWTQPVSGGPASQLTDYKSDRIFNFAWSRDGKRLALAHGWESSDVALIQNFR